MAKLKFLSYLALVLELEFSMHARNPKGRRLETRNWSRAWVTAVFGNIYIGERGFFFFLFFFLLEKKNEVMKALLNADVGL